MKAKINTVPIVILVLGIILTIYLSWLVYLGYEIPYLPGKDFIHTENVILFLSFLALVWYAWETRELRKTTKNQLELEQRPILNLYYRSESKKKGRLRIRNVGRGIAYNIRVSSIKINKNNFKFRLDGPNLTLIPGEEKTLTIKELNEKTNRNGKIVSIGGRLDSLNAFLDEIVKASSRILYYQPDDLKDLSGVAKINIFYENDFRVFYQSGFNFYSRDLPYREDRGLQIGFVEFKTNGKKRF